jgi:hypothetical protein
MAEEIKKEESFRLVPLYDIKAIWQAFGIITEGVEECLKNSGTDTSFEKIFNDAVGGKTLIWVALLDRKYVGFVTTQTIEFPYKKNLYINQCYKVRGISPLWLLKGVEILKQWAIEQNCNGVRFYAFRKEWSERLKAAGFGEGYTEYTMDVEQKTEKK